MIYSQIRNEIQKFDFRFYSGHLRTALAVGVRYCAGGHGFNAAGNTATGAAIYTTVDAGPGFTGRAYCQCARERGSEWTNHCDGYVNGPDYLPGLSETGSAGGDPTGTGYGDPGYTFDDEIDPNLTFDRPGRLAMANSGPNTNGSQFFITEQGYDTLNGHYTLFGQCDDAGVAVVKTIARVPRDSNDKPETPVVLQKVTIVPEGQAVPPPPAVPQPATQP